jgi:hypothetical protein
MSGARNKRASFKESKMLVKTTLTNHVDRDGESFDPAGIDFSSVNPALLVNFDVEKPIGMVYKDSFKLTEKGLEINFEITDKKIIKALKKSEKDYQKCLMTIQMLGQVTDRVLAGDIAYVNECKLYSLSVVENDKGINPNNKIEVVSQEEPRTALFALKGKGVPG